MATIGVSTERGIAQAVSLAALSHPGVESHGFNRREQSLVEDRSSDTGTAVLAVLEAMEADLGGSIDGAAVAYAHAEERSVIVSALASGRWSASSVVSAQSAQLAAIQRVPGLDAYRDVLLYEATARSLAHSVVDSTRTCVTGSGSLRVDSLNFESVGRSLQQARTTLEEMGVEPDAVVLFGPFDAGAVEILENAFHVPVIASPGHATATALGAALLAERDIPPVASTMPGRSSHKRSVVAAAVIAVLGAGGALAWGIGAGSDSGGEVSAAHSLPLTSTRAVPGPASTEAGPAALPRAHPTTSPVGRAAAPPIVPGSASSSAVGSDPATGVDRRSSRPLGTQRTVNAGPPPPLATAPPATVASEPVTPSPVGAPGGNWLFQGEAPPPPLGADPAVAQQWWDHHWALKDRWLHGG